MPWPFRARGSNPLHRELTPSRPRVPGPSGGRLLCGQDLGDGLTCHVPATASHSHTSPRVEQGLFPSLTTEAATKRLAEVIRAVGFDAPQGSLRRYMEPTPAEVHDDAKWAVEHEAVGAAYETGPAECGTPDPVQEVDFREMLGDDDHAWSVRNRLTAVLGRPYLATQIAQHLPADVSARLADRLDSLVSQAIADDRMRTNQAVATATNEAWERIRSATHEARAQLRKELHGERFGRSSRLD